MKAEWQHVNYFQGQIWSVCRFKSGCAKLKVGPPHQQERGEDFTGRSRSEASVWWVRGSAVALLGKRSRLCVTVCSQESVSQNEEHRPWLRLWLARAATKPSESPQSNGLLFKYFNRSQFSTGECGAGTQQKMVQQLLQRSASLCEAQTHPPIPKLNPQFSDFLKCLKLTAPSILKPVPIKIF